MNNISQRLQSLAFARDTLDCLQFFESATEYLYYAQFHTKAIDRVFDASDAAYKEWNQKLMKEGRVDIGINGGLPTGRTNYFGIELDTNQATNIIIRSVLQNYHSFFDNFAQFINRAVLGGNALPVHEFYLKNLSQKLVKRVPDLNTRFVNDLVDVLNTFVSSSEFIYIDDLNNVMKHRYIVGTNDQIFLNTGEHTVHIHKFHKSKDHEEKELKTFLIESSNAINTFYTKTTECILAYLASEDFPKQEMRIHNIESCIENIKIDDSIYPRQVFFIISDNQFNIGDTYEILSAYVNDNVARIDNVEVNRIFVKNNEGKYTYSLVHRDALSNDHLYVYRKFSVDTISTDIVKTIYEFLEQGK